MIRVKIILLLSIFLFSNTLSQTNWEWISPNPPYKEVYSSCTVDYLGYFWGESNSVLRIDFTNDNIKMMPTYGTYENCGPGDFSSQGIAFADSLNGYITDVCNGQFRTTDGGLTWSKIADSGSNITLVAFSGQAGWKLGAGGFYKTSDAGNSWNYSTMPWSNGGNFTRLYALNQNQLWVLKESSYNGIGAGVLYSSTGGSNWSNINTGLVSDSLNKISYLDISMDQSGKGYIIGTIYRSEDGIYDGLILKTTDTGLSWTHQVFPGETFKQIFMPDDQNAIIIGNIGLLDDYHVIQRKTIDDGNTWQYSIPVTNNQGYFYLNNAIYYPGTDGLYLLGTGGIYKSNDRGLSYQKLTSETDVVVTDLTFDSKPPDKERQLGIAWLSWNTKPYLITSDGGKTWQKKLLPESMGYLWSFSIAENVIYTVTSQTKLYKSTDYGESWTFLNVPVYGSALRTLKAFSKDILVISAYKNLISTTDGGNSWLLSPLSDNILFEDIDITEAGYIAGLVTYYDSASHISCFFRTTDFGRSWHIFDVNNELNKIEMKNDSVGYAVGNKIFYKTTNGAQSWETLLTRGNTWGQGFSCFTFKDSINGIIKSDEGEQITYDGGKNWINVDYKLPISQDKMAFNANGDLFMLGEGIMIKIPSDKNNFSNNITRDDTNISNYLLDSAFPNPFNPTTTIRYRLPNNAFVTLKIYDVLGAEVTTLVNEYKDAGIYEVRFNASNLASGVYIYKLQAENFVSSKKMLLIK